MTIYFYDFEFNENGKTIEPLSLGIVSNDHRELYIEYQFDAAKLEHDNPWVWKNVVPLLRCDPRDRLTVVEAREAILHFLGWKPSWARNPPVPRPEFWGYFADYDHVLWCQHFGKMIDLPPGLPMLTMDLQQLHIHLGSPAHLRPASSPEQHNALEDARWNQRFHANLAAFAKGGEIAIRT